MPTVSSQSFMLIFVVDGCDGSVGDDDESSSNGGFFGRNGKGRVSVGELCITGSDEELVACPVLWRNRCVLPRYNCWVRDE